MCRCAARLSFIGQSVRLCQKRVTARGGWEAAHRACSTVKHSCIYANCYICVAIGVFNDAINDTHIARSRCLLKDTSLLLLLLLLQLLRPCLVQRDTLKISLPWERLLLLHWLQRMVLVQCRFLCRPRVRHPQHL